MTEFGGNIPSNYPIRPNHPIFVLFRVQRTLILTPIYGVGSWTTCPQTPKNSRTVAKIQAAWVRGKSGDSVKMFLNTPCIQGVPSLQQYSLAFETDQLVNYIETKFPGIINKATDLYVVHDIILAFFERI